MHGILLKINSLKIGHKLRLTYCLNKNFFASGVSSRIPLCRNLYASLPAHHSDALRTFFSRLVRVAKVACSWVGAGRCGVTGQGERPLGGRRAADGLRGAGVRSGIHIPPCSSPTPTDLPLRTTSLTHHPPTLPVFPEVHYPQRTSFIN